MKTFIILITLLLASCSTIQKEDVVESVDETRLITIFTMCDIPVYMMHVPQKGYIELIPINSRDPEQIEYVINIARHTPKDFLAVVKLDKQLWDISGISCKGSEV